MTNVKKNTNCLEGFRCPECGSLEPFYIDVITTVRMWDEGSDNDHHQGDMNWEDDSDCMCVECGHEDKVKGFKTNISKKSIW